jgi:alpha-L-fucosidase
MLQGARAETASERDARMAWWREARFGMFVHWGLYSGLAGTWDGKPVGTSGGMEWIQQRVKVDTDTYAKEAIPKFKPAAEFARQWAKLAKEAGCNISSLLPNTTRASACSIRKPATTTPGTYCTVTW